MDSCRFMAISLKFYRWFFRKNSWKKIDDYKGFKNLITIMQENIWSTFKMRTLGDYYRNRITNRYQYVINDWINSQKWNLSHNTWSCMNNFYKNKDSSYLKYLDKNYLYGKTISEKLFEFVNLKGIRHLNLQKNSSKFTKTLVLVTLWKLKWNIMTNCGCHLMIYLSYKMHCTY